MTLLKKFFNTSDHYKDFDTNVKIMIPKVLEILESQRKKCAKLDFIFFKDMIKLGYTREDSKKDFYSKILNPSIDIEMQKKLTNNLKKLKLE